MLALILKNLGQGRSVLDWGLLLANYFKSPFNSKGTGTDKSYQWWWPTALNKA